MTTTADLGRFQELTDRAELADLLARHGLWMDEERFDPATAAEIFTPDATVRTQSGQSQGLEALAAHGRRVHANYSATQHITTNVLIALDGDRATLRANLLATFVHDSPDNTSSIGERYRFEAVRTPAGWRFSSVQVIPVWTSRD